jgi:hypothetical protein
LIKINRKGPATGSVTNRQSGWMTAWDTE